MFTVYAVYNKKHQKIYIGQTENIEERLRLHNSKSFKSSYAARFDGDWQLIYKEKVSTRKEAAKKLQRKRIYKKTYPGARLKIQSSAVAQW